MPSTSVRVDRETHEELKKLAKELGTTVGEAVAIAARRLRQQRIGRELKTSLTKEEVAWLDADLG
jgi:antitoxin component of RelBE/YafQ-DinJ toxin-antitoxin module